MWSASLSIWQYSTLCSPPSCSLCYIPPPPPPPPPARFQEAWLLCHSPTCSHLLLHAPDLRQQQACSLVLSSVGMQSGTVLSGHAVWYCPQWACSLVLSSVGLQSGTVLSGHAVWYCPQWACSLVLSSAGMQSGTVLEWGQCVPGMGPALRLIFLLASSKGQIHSQRHTLDLRLTTEKRLFAQPLCIQYATTVSQ